MTWFAFNGYNTIELAGLQEKEATSYGFHGYATQALAEKYRNSVNFVQAPVLDLLEADYNTARFAGQQPGGPNSNLANPASIPGSVGTAAGNAAGGLGNFVLHTTGNFHTVLIRAAEIILGLLLIGIGLVKLSGGAQAAISKVPVYGKAIGALT
jgi:hypothetical protein